MDQHSRPGPETTTLEAVGNQWRYALVVVQTREEEEEEESIISIRFSGANRFILFGLPNLYESIQIDFPISSL